MTVFTCNRLRENKPMPNKPIWRERWAARARSLKTEVHALFLACRDRRVPWQAKLVAGLVVAYALSPIDLIPDFIPVLGYLDDMVLLPLGILLVLKLIPDEVMQECRARAAEALPVKSGSAVVGAVIVVILWLIAIGALVVLGKRLMT